MRNVPIRGYTDRNGRRVRAYIQRRREAHDDTRNNEWIAQANLSGRRWSGPGRSKMLLAATFRAIVLLAVFGAGVWAVLAIIQQIRTASHDRVSDSAPMSSSSSWFSTSAVLCEGVGGYTPAVRCSLVDHRHLKPAGTDPLCASPWYGTLIALSAGSAPRWVCPQGPLVAASPSAALDAGQTATFGTLTHGPIRCRGTSGSGVYCVDEQTGYGFTLGPSGYQVNAGPFG